MIRFADNAVLLPKIDEKLGSFLNGVDKLLNKRFRLKINKRKIKIMRCSRNVQTVK